MKILLITLLLATSTFHVFPADDHRISCGFRLQDGKDILSSPSVTAKPGQPFEIAITRDYVQEPGLLLPMGVILKGQTSWMDGKVHYSFTLTIRDSTANRTDHHTSKYAAFKTEEYLLSGIAVPGKDHSIVLSHGKKITLLLSTEKNPTK